MWIIIWVIQSFLNSIWMILTKKVLENKKVWNNLQTLFSRTNHFIIIILLFTFWFFDFNMSNWTFSNKDILLLLIATTWLYLTYPLRRTAYANEKISTLQPFSMLFQVFPIIIWFIFIASERANFLTFVFALLASMVAILPNIDFKTFKINKYSLMVLLSSIIKSFQLFATVYFLTKLDPVNFYLLETIIIIIFSFLLLLIKKEFYQFKLLNKKYLKLLTSANTVAVWSIIMVLTMYSSLWVVATSLLSLLYIFFVFSLWYIFLWEKPSKKDIITTILISICIFLGLYFKN